MAQGAPSDASVKQVTMERSGEHALVRVLVSDGKFPSAQPCPGTEGDPWQTGDASFAVELQGPDTGFVLGNVAVSEAAHAVVAVNAEMGAMPLIFVATPQGGDIPAPMAPRGAAADAWEPVAAPPRSAANGSTLSSVAASALSAVGSALSGVARAASASMAAGPGPKGRRTEAGLRPAGPAPAAAPAPEPTARAGPSAPAVAAARPAGDRGAPGNTLRDAVRAALTARYDVPAVPRPPSDPRGTALALELGPATRSSFAANGYVVLHDVVPTAAVHAALRVVNSDLGRQACGPSMFEPAADGSAGSAGSAGAGLDAPPGATGFAHSITAHPDVMALLWRTQAWGAAASVLGPGCIDAPAAAQMALRFPKPPGVESHWGSRHGPAEAWHIDGMDERKFAPFGLLVGVLLSDTPAPDMGQLIVHPGSHRAIARDISVRGGAWVSPNRDLQESKPHLDGAERVQITGRAGSVVLAHPLLAHTVGINYSPHVRYCAYFRVSRRDHDDLRVRLPEQPMCGYPGAAE